MPGRVGFRPLRAAPLGKKPHSESPVIITLVSSAVAACLVSMLATGLVCRIAPKLGLVDEPDQVRKLHTGPVALGGGAAVFATFLLVLLVVALVFAPAGMVGAPFWKLLLRLLPAAAVLVAVGLADDRRGLRGRQKLAGQLVAATILISGGLWIGNLSVLGLQIDLGVLAVPFTLFWILGAINALNLLDGLDGVATIVGLILVAAVGVMAGLVHRPEVALVAFTFAGALIGFLRYNFPPARIFLGDAGSMLIGLVVGTLAVEASLKGAGTLLLAAPLAIWFVPVFDTTLAILRRTLTGRSIYTTDRGHLHHRLLERLGSNRRVLAWVGGLCAVSSAAALVSIWLSNDLVAVLTAGTLVLVCVVGNVVGRAEVALLLRRMHRLAASLLPRPAEPEDWEDTVEIQGQGPWRTVWAYLTTEARQGSADRMELTVSLPALGNCFHARWGRPTSGEPDRCWSVVLPLMCGPEQVGLLQLAGPRNGQPLGNPLDEALRLAEYAEGQIAQFAEGMLPVPVAAPAHSAAATEPLPGNRPPGEQEPASETLPRKHPK